MAYDERDSMIKSLYTFQCANFNEKYGGKINFGLLVFEQSYKNRCFIELIPYSGEKFDFAEKKTFYFNVHQLYSVKEIFNRMSTSKNPFEMAISNTNGVLYIGSHSNLEKIDENVSSSKDIRVGLRYVYITIQNKKDQTLRVYFPIPNAEFDTVYDNVDEARTFLPYDNYVKMLIDQFDYTLKLNTNIMINKFSPFTVLAESGRGGRDGGKHYIPKAPRSYQEEDESNTAPVRRVHVEGVIKDENEETSAEPERKHPKRSEASSAPKHKAPVVSTEDVVDDVFKDAGV